MANNILSSVQSRFRRGQSTATAHTAMSGHILEVLKKNMASFFVLLDYIIAFDTINNNLLISKCKYLEFDCISLKFLQSYFIDRIQRVCLDGECSKAKYIFSGVPQGWLLGPLSICDSRSTAAKSIASMTALKSITTSIPITTKMQNIQTILNLSTSACMVQNQKHSKFGNQNR